MDKRVLKLTFGEPLVQSGFKRKGQSWYRQMNNVLQIVDLQKCDYAARYYLNLGFLPDGMIVEGMPTPPEWKFPVRARAIRVFPSHREEIERTFDLERSDIDDPKWKNELTDISQNIVLPFMDSIADIKAIRVAIKEGVFRSGMVYGTAVDYLGVDPPIG